MNPNSFYKDPGSLYTVDLPDEHIENMLDWDKPLSEQPEIVKKYFEPLIEKRRYLEAQVSGPEWGDFADPRNYDPTGQELMRFIGSGDRMDASAILSGGTGGPQSSELLMKSGIPGIKYLDQSSRGAGEGTRNFVVFDPSILSILKRE